MLQRKENHALQRGFTLVELLVVIAIIGVLAGLAFAYLASSQTSAQAAKITEQLEEIEKALALYALSENLQSWPVGGSAHSEIPRYSIENLIETGGAGGGEPAEFPGFDKYLAAIGEPLPGAIYSYYNIGVPYTCNEDSRSHKSSVRIRIGSYEDNEPDPQKVQEIFEILDEDIDNNDGPDCGRVGKGGSSGSIYYLVRF